ncbi:PCDH11Y isoform 4, partial [Pongo abelii]
TTVGFNSDISSVVRVNTTNCNKCLLSGTYIFAVLLACVVFHSGAQEKNYTIREEMPENVLIGDLLKDLNLSLIPNKS